MPATLRQSIEPRPLGGPILLGPRGPFPDIGLRRVLERRWLHYAFLTPGGELGMVANVAHLGPAPDDPLGRPRCTSILLVYQSGVGWCASQFNAQTLAPLWSAFARPSSIGNQGRFELESTARSVGVAFDLTRTSRPCTSQCAPFAGVQHLRWQSESGVRAHGDWHVHGNTYHGVSAVGYHERVRGYWGWPELGGWVFGFVNDADGGDAAPATAIVFTLIQPRGPADAATGSVMLWQHGRLRRHFPRRRVTVAVHEELDRDRVCQVPAMANVLGVPPTAAIPRRLVVAAQLGLDWVVLDFACESAARVVVPCETGIRPFSVHEVIGRCRVEGRVGRATIDFRAPGIVEFAGGAGGH